MDAIQLDALIKVVKKLTNTSVAPTYKVGAPINEVFANTFEIQGINKAIKVLEDVRDGHIRLKDFLHEE